MKPTFLSAKELACELGMSVDSIYRAYRKGEIPAAQICRTLRFDLHKVQRAMERKAKLMPNSRCSRSATGGASRRRVQRTSPRLGKTGASIAQRSVYEFDKYWIRTGARCRRGNNRSG